jgi:hypothetical protein
VTHRDGSNRELPQRSIDVHRAIAGLSALFTNDLFATVLVGLIMLLLAADAHWRRRR